MTITFQELGLVNEILRAVSHEGYENPTPIQAKAIPIILAGHDVLASAQTGTGKTASFTLPLLQLLAADKPKRRVVRALILTPTRELALQVAESVRTYGRHLALTSAEIYGGVGYHQQLRALRTGVDIVIATPGRLLDLIDQGSLDLQHVNSLVLDEADRMLDMGFMPAIKKILPLLQSDRQNLLFSATLSKEIKQLANQLLNDPQTIQIQPKAGATQLIEQRFYRVENKDKKLLLLHLLQTESWYKALIFTRTKFGASRLAEDLVKRGYKATAIHGDKSQAQRSRALQQFKHDKVQILVATDVAARGLDIDQLPYVVNFDLPKVVEDYVHRIGRTGRAGASGQAVSFMPSNEQFMLKKIQTLFKEKLTLLATKELLDSLPPLPSVREESFVEDERRSVYRKDTERNSRMRMPQEKRRSYSTESKYQEERGNYQNSRRRRGEGREEGRSESRRYPTEERRQRSEGRARFSNESFDHRRSSSGEERPYATRFTENGGAHQNKRRRFSDQANAPTGYRGHREETTEYRAGPRQRRPAASERFATTAGSNTPRRRERAVKEERTFDSRKSRRQETTTYALTEKPTRRQRVMAGAYLATTARPAAGKKMKNSRPKTTRRYSE